MSGSTRIVPCTALMSASAGETGGFQVSGNSAAARLSISAAYRSRLALESPRGRVAWITAIARTTSRQIGTRSAATLTVRLRDGQTNLVFRR